jgi:hypothetical protein
MWQSPIALSLPSAADAVALALASPNLLGPVLRTGRFERSQLEGEMWGRLIAACRSGNAAAAGALLHCRAFPLCDGIAAESGNLEPPGEFGVDCYFIACSRILMEAGTPDGGAAACPHKLAAAARGLAWLSSRTWGRGSMNAVIEAAMNVACGIGHARALAELAITYRSAEGFEYMDWSLFSNLLGFTVGYGHADVVREIAAIAVYERAAGRPFNFVDNAPSNALVMACQLKRGRGAAVVAALAAPGISAHERVRRKIQRRALAKALASMDAGLMRALGTPPWTLGRADVLDVPDFDLGKAIESDCGAEFVEVLSRPPWTLGYEYASSGDNFPLYIACQLGDVDVLAALAAPSYGLRHADATVEGDDRASGSGALLAACECGHADIVDALALPPWSLTAKDARYENSRALREACANGHSEVVRALARPPYSLAGADARFANNEALINACANGHDAVLEALAEPPYLLDGADARAKGNAALRLACADGHIDVAIALANPPYSLGSADAIGIDMSKMDPEVAELYSK